MSKDFPERIKQLPSYTGRFDAVKLAADGADVLFASYPAGTEIEPHEHASENVGVITKGELHLTMENKTIVFTVGEWYHVPAGVTHAAFFPCATHEIEFWFKEA